MKKITLKNRILSGILALALFMSCVPMSIVAEDVNEFQILSYSRASGPITFPKNEKIVITASGYPEGADLQWQIAMPDDGGWVDIMGQEEENLTLSYALIANIMDDSGLTSVRCGFVFGDLCQYTTPVDIRILPEETTVPMEETVEPSEETAAPTEETVNPSEETTAPTEETVEPSEETTVPTEETGESSGETTAPTEETVNPSEETTVPAEETAERLEEGNVLHVADNGDQPSLASALPRAAAPTFVTITINYLWDDPNDTTDTLVALVEPYVANILKGESLKVDEPMPNRPGYQPQINGMDWNKERYTREFTAEETIEDIVIDVIYVQVPVTFYVRYFLQNVTDDLYTERPEFSQRLQNAGVFTGYEGQSPDKNKIDLKSNALTKADAEGFSSLFIQPDEIAADGSTVFEFYYDRLYYLMSFDLDGGFGTEPVYARYGTEFSIPAPEKPGWIFAGWELVKVNGVDVEDGDNDGDPGDGTDHLVGSKDSDSWEYSLSMPHESRAYKAIWTTKETSFTVVYWREKADAVDNPALTVDQKKVQNYEFWGSVEKKENSGENVDGKDDVPSDVTTITVKDQNGWDVPLDERRFFTYNDNLTDKNVQVLGDGSSVVNVYYDRNEYTLKFYYAMETKDDQDQSKEGHQHIYVVGGSTYYFGNLASSIVDKNDEKALLSQYLMNVIWQNGNSTAIWKERGTVTSLPQFNEKGRNLLSKPNGSGYTLPEPEEITVTSSDFGNYKLHYFSFKAKYNADISELWPCDVFEPAERADTSSDSNGWAGKKTFVSAWNGEYNVYYSRKTGNQTIKGNYQRLDYKLLWADADPEDRTVSYLCFWENGTESENLKWSVPELWFYRQWVPAIDGQTDGKITTTYNGVTYELQSQYPTCDNSTVGEQTQVAIDGFTGKERELMDSSVNEYERTTTFINNQPVLKIPDKTNKVLEDYEKLTDTDLNLESYIRHFVVDFYYTRNNYNLKFYNLLDSSAPEKEKQVPFGTSLTDEFFVPQYPSNLEPDSYTFAGWYTTPLFLEGTEFGITFDEEGNYASYPFADKTMPSNDVALYAKWEPITHDVYFYTDLDNLKAGTDIDAYAHPNVPHGGHINTGDNKATIPYPEPSEDNVFKKYVGYDFMGWFYLDENNEKVAFDPNSMEIRQDMHLYADWQTSVVTKYEVYYVKAQLDSEGNVLTDANGNWIPVTDDPDAVLAESTQNLIFTGTTKTFKAKGIPRESDNDPIWLPETNSHSLLMKPPAGVDDSNLPLAPEENKYYFCYVSRQFAPYSVEYLDAETGKPIPAPGESDGSTVPDKVVSDNKNAVVSEMPIFIEGYTAKEAYKTLVLSANEEENVIRFYYTKNEDESSQEHYYLVHHYVENADGTFTTDDDGKAERVTYGDFSVYETKGYKANIGASVSAQPLTLTGYTYQDGFELTEEGYKEVKTGEVTKEPMLELKLYYTRTPYPYVVKHLVYGAQTETLLPLPDDYDGGSNQEVGYMPYDATLTANALENVPGYELVDNISEKSLRIAMEDGADPEFNVITFYYKARETEIIYTPVCTETSVDVSKWLDIVSERTVAYNDIRGSTPYVLAGYTFKGWL